MAWKEEMALEMETMPGIMVGGVGGGRKAPRQGNTGMSIS